MNESQRMLREGDYLMDVITEQQWKEWNHIVNLCKGNNKSINVGSKKLRETIIAIDEKILELQVELMLEKEKRYRK